MRVFDTDLRPGRARGATSAEYMLILILVVIPIALLAPMLVAMIATYTYRIGWVIRLPFG